MQTIPNIQQVYGYPIQKDPRAYPAIIYYPESIDNAFETNKENMKTYTFAVFIVIKIAGKTSAEIYGDILPQTFTDFESAFDAEWNFGTVDGHRVWAKQTSSLVGFSVEQNGQIGSMEIKLQVKALTNN